MNELLRRRLVGLAVLLLGLFLLSWFVPGGDGRGVEPGTPSTLVALGPGAATELTAGADAAHEVPPTPAEPEPAAAASSAPPIADLTGDAKPAPGPARAEPAPKPVPKVSSEAPAESRKPVPVAKLAPQKAETAKPAPPKPVEKSPPPAKPVMAEKPAMAQTGWWIQIGSYSDHSKAETILSLLRKIGHRGELTTIQGKKGLLNRVRLGPYPNEAAARIALPKVAHQGYPQAQVVFER